MAKGLLAAGFGTSAVDQSEFNDWYDTEHLPFLAAVPGVLSARRFQAGGEGVERKYLALYHLTDADVSRSDAWTKAARTPWSARINRYFSDLLVIRCRKYTRA